MVASLLLLGLIACEFLIFATGLMVGFQWGEREGRLCERYNGPDEEQPDTAGIESDALSQT